MKKVVVKALLLACASSLSSCAKVKKAAETTEAAIFEEPAYVAVEGDDAAQFLHVVPGTAPIDPAAMLKAMDVGATEAANETLKLRGFNLDSSKDDVQQVDGDTIDYMTAGAQAKDDLNADAFKQPGLTTMFAPPKVIGAGLVDDTVPVVDAAFDPKADQVDPAIFGDKAEITITTLSKISVKDQGQRSTCASHAGLGFLEYLIMKKHAAELTSVDLSEQRFYMLSKSDLWDKGGGVTNQDGGSSWVSGYEMSFGKDGKNPPADPAHTPYNIPVEADCPYDGADGANEIQIAQANTCLRGAVRVSSVTQTYQSSTDGGSTWIMHSNAPRSATDIINFIKTYDLPVPIGTTLTANWMNNDGMITYAKSQQPGWGVHAGGHAYLIVGARKLDEAKFPGEGGLCFVIKNSWGTGWGQNGFSCMTLAWFNHNRDNSSYDVALDVDVDLDYLKQHATGTPPPALPTPVAGPVTPAPAPTPEAAPTVVPGPAPTPSPVAAVPDVGDNTGKGTDPAPTPAPATPATPPTVVPPTTADGYTVGRLATRGGRLEQVLFKTSSASFVMRGVLQGQAQATQDLTLGLDGTTILLDDQKRNKLKVPVGTIDGDLVTLCSGKYALTCDLHLVKAENRLAIGITETEFRTYEPNPHADYKTLFNLANYGVDFAIDGIYTDLRLQIAGQPTNPIRLAVKPVSGTIVYRGREIGNYQKAMLCTGDYASLCRILVNQGDHSLKIFFKSKKPAAAP